jgi:nucleotide-binding universal stress UspA family protein
MIETTEHARRDADMTMKVLLPVDGSVFSGRVVDYVIKVRKTHGSMDVHVLNVQIPIASGHARMFATQAEIDDYHREEGLKVLEATLKRLHDEGIPCTYHVLVGHAAETIVRFAEEHNFDKVVMGTHGRSGLTQLLLGSVAEDVLKKAKIPVVLVK